MQGACFFANTLVHALLFVELDQFVGDDLCDMANKCAFGHSTKEIMGN